MAEETKFTFKIGIFVSFVAAVVVFVLQCLWGHQTDISVLKTNQATILKSIDKLDRVPSDIARLEVLLNENREAIIRRIDKK